MPYVRRGILNSSFPVNVICIVFRKVFSMKSIVACFRAGLLKISAIAHLQSTILDEFHGRRKSGSKKNGPFSPDILKLFSFATNC